MGGTSLSAPAWAGLLALVNQGRAAAGESTLNSSSPTETQQALYMLPQSDYNVIASGNNGYAAGAGYNLVTGLGTPVANLLVPDLIAYQGPARPTRARPWRLCRMPGWSTPGRVPAVRSMSSACSTLFDCPAADTSTISIAACSRARAASRSC